MKKLYTLLVVLVTLSSTAQIVNIPDANFKAKLLAATFSNGIARNLQGSNFKIDANNDGEIQESEAIQVSALFINNSGITNFSGILSFPNLTILDCHNNNAYTIDLNGLTNLQLFYCYNSFLSSLSLTNVPSLVGINCSNTSIGNLDFSNCPNITDINCNQSNLSSLNLSGLTNLNNLDCGTNLLTSLDISSSNLTRLECQGNQLTQLDLSLSTNLQYLNCSSNNLITLNINGLISIDLLWCSYNNNLTTLDVTPLMNITELDCSNTQIGVLNTSNLPNLSKLRCFRTSILTLDVSNSPNLGTLVCMQNPLLASLFMKNGSNETYSLDFGTNPSLRYICADESQLVAVQTKLTQYNMTNCHVNSYCSFVPGGTFYTIQGTTRFDTTNNGCDATDINISNQRFTISSGSISGSIIANQMGAYSIPVQSGTHTITPNFENPSYFIVSPATATVTFPITTSPDTQNFCVTANGIKNDVEVTILSTVPARPGFDAQYKIIYKNKGNQVSNGTLSFSFDDAKMDLLSAMPVNTGSATNSLSWTYSNLNPFETREIIVVFNINSPMETPAVNGGDVLDYTATVVGATDETPNDNTMTLNQIVVNSYDPNDKTCLEGTTITPSMVGDYVHYVIRFENTGTFPAQNVVVSDVINTSKFELASLVPQSSSHSFVTRVNNATGKVEFIFENINLPFDDANNDGYVAFKIKTKPTLVLGNTFSNTANIYFDYNFPIVTNTATTTIAALSNQDFDFGSYFSVYPIPAKDVLHLETKNEIGVKAVSIYNTLGQIVLVVINPENNAAIDVANLKTGTYFIKVMTDLGTANTKFIKE